MLGDGRGQGRVRSLAADLVGEGDARSTHGRHGGGDFQDVVVVGGPQEPHLGLDDRKTHTPGLQIAVEKAAPPEQVGAPDLEPGEILGVVRDAHLVRLRIPHADGGGRAVGGHGPACRSRRTAASGSAWPKTAWPATTMSAPASASARTFEPSTPPSTSICTDRPRSATMRRRRRTFSRLPGMKAWPEKPGFTDITRT